MVCEMAALCCCSLLLLPTHEVPNCSFRSLRIRGYVRTVMPSAHIPVHAGLRSGCKACETRCLASSLRHDRGWDRVERLPRPVVGAHASIASASAAQKFFPCLRPGCLGPAAFPSAECGLSAHFGHCIASFFAGEPRGNSYVRASGCHLRLSHRARLLVACCLWK